MDARGRRFAVEELPHAHVHYVSLAFATQAPKRLRHFMLQANSPGDGAGATSSSAVSTLNLCMRASCHVPFVLSVAASAAKSKDNA
jgi:hypothetical protein